MLSVCAEANLSAIGWISFDVTNHVIDALNSELTNLDLLVKAKTEEASSNNLGADIYGSERGASFSPKLVINSTTTIYASDDTWIDASSPNSTPGNSWLAINARIGMTNRCLFRFSLEGITDVATATFSVNVSSRYGTGVILQAYKCTKADWVENQATWNIYKTGSNWTTAGGDYVAEVEDLPSGPAQRIWPAKYPRLYP